MPNTITEQIPSLTGLLKGKLDYVLELSILQESQFCLKPVYKAEYAFINGEDFCLIYSEADDPDTVCASYNSRKFEKILPEYNICKTIFHGENGAGEFYESFYYKGLPCPMQASVSGRLNFRLLIPGDIKLTEAQSKNGDDYFNIIFEDFIVKKIWNDCGIIGAFLKLGSFNNFIGYIAYYEFAENIRDISYLYVKPDFRRQGCAKQLLNCFKNKNISESKLSYYSYAVNEASVNLAKSCGFLPCAGRYEREI